MPLKVITSSLQTFCEVHGCINRVKYAIGNPAAPRTQLYICGKCMKDLIADLPKELLPNLGPEEVEPHEPANVSPQGKSYDCQYCGTEFSTPQAKGNHVKSCPMNPKNQGEGGE